MMTFRCNCAARGGPACACNWIFSICHECTKMHGAPRRTYCCSTWPGPNFSFPNPMLQISGSGIRIGGAEVPYALSSEPAGLVVGDVYGIRCWAVDGHTGVLNLMPITRFSKEWTVPGWTKVNPGDEYVGSGTSTLGKAQSIFSGKVRGFYSWKDFESVDDNSCGPIVGVIQLRGETMEHERGYRSTEAKIVAWSWNPHSHETNSLKTMVTEVPAWLMKLYVPTPEHLGQWVPMKRGELNA